MQERAPKATPQGKYADAKLRKTLEDVQWNPLPVGKLTGKQKNYLRGLAHRLAPVVHIGHEGSNKSTLGEIRKQLILHELIKVKWNQLEADEDGTKKGQAQRLADLVGAHFVNLIGHVVILYRRRDPAFHKKNCAKEIDLPLS